MALTYTVTGTAKIDGTSYADVPITTSNDAVDAVISVTVDGKNIELGLKIADITAAMSQVQHGV